MISDPETQKVLEENKQLKDRLEALEAKMAGGVPKVPALTGPLPQYRLIKPFYGPDDHYYDPEEGDEVIEWTGTPNDCMEPLNEPAKRRMEAYLASLPTKKIEQEFIIEASMMLRPREGEKVVPYAEVMRKAMELQAKAKGRPIEEVEISMPQKQREVPAMGNDPKAAERKRKARGEMLTAMPDPAAPKKGQPKKVTGTENANVPYGS